MIRLILLIVVVALISWAAAWLTDRPGLVSLAWQGYRIETSVAVLAAALLAGAVVIGLLIMLVRWLLLTPERVRAARRDARKLRGFRALTQGLVAAAAGDTRGARQSARAAEVLLGEPPLTLLLEAQAAQLEGDDQTADQAFRRMLKHPDTEFLGLRGLMVQATRRGDHQEALALARRAFEINPGAGWVLSNLVPLEISAGEWRRAEKAVDAAVQAKRMSRSEGRRKRALLLLQRAIAAEAEGADEKALSLARKAVDRAPDLIPASVFAGKLMVRTGRLRPARRLLARAWAETPHRDLAQVFVTAVDDPDVSARLRRIEKLVSVHPEEAEGHIAVAEAALAADAWPVARAHLGHAARLAPTARVCRLMAMLEERETGDRDAARYWLVQATEAPLDPTWVCDRCGTPAQSWSLRCSQCDSFDSLAWRTVDVASVPPGAPALTALTAAPEPITTQLGVDGVDGGAPSTDLVVEDQADDRADDSAVPPGPIADKAADEAADESPPTRA